VVLVGTAVLAVVAALVLLRPSNAVKSLASGAAVGDAAPNFSLRELDGREARLSDERGRVVVLNFWATWCVPCRSEMPAIERVYRSHPGQFAVLAIDKDEPRGDVRDFARKLGLTFPLVLDPSLAAWTAYGIRIQPVSVWIDRNGVIRAIHYGPMDARYIRGELARLLA
jgi:peroxiredoxin